MDEVVDLGAGANDGTPSGSPVYTGIIAYFDIITYNDIANLKNLAMFPFFRYVAKTVAADYCA